MDQGASCALTLHMRLCSSVYLTCPVLYPLSQMPGTEGILGTREVNTGLVFSKDPHLGEAVHWGPGSGEECRAPAWAVQGGFASFSAVPVGGKGRAS